MLINLSILLVALVCIVLAAQKTVDSLIGVAKVYNIPDALIAMSVVALGTSLPEIGSHLTASFSILGGHLDLQTTSYTVIGGNMGSSTVQQILFVGILFIGLGAREYRKRFFIDTYLPMLGAFILFFGLAYDGTVGRVDGAVMLLVFAGFMVTSYQYREREFRLRTTPTIRSAEIS